jgi:hypothetical protein
MITVTLGDGERDAPRAATKARVSEASKYTQAHRSPPSHASSWRLAALEQEVARMRMRDEPAGQTEPPPTELPSPEEERRRVEDHFTELERQLLAEPVDPSWSGGATESLRTSLSGVGANDGFDLLAAECRTQTCRATLRWPSYEAAVETGMRLPERAIPGLNCTSSIWLKEPAPGQAAGSYAASLFLDCSEQRAGTVDNIQQE